MLKKVVESSMYSVLSYLYMKMIGLGHFWIWFLISKFMLLEFLVVRY